MFDPTDRPRFFGLPPGTDFAATLVAGLELRLDGQPPEAMARVEIFVNTRRMQRRLKDVFAEGPPRLLPRIRLVTDLAMDAATGDLPPPVSPLRRRLELTQLIGRLLDAEPDLAPRAALFDLADSLADLMDEMRGEGVGADAIRNLDVTDVSGHWQRSLKFIELVETWLGDEADNAPDVETRQRLVIERLVAGWADTPPAHPVLVAGSTGSRGATALFMQAVARLPQGAVILPGVDFDLPRAIWDRLDDAMSAEDHPQYRFARLMQGTGCHPVDIAHWHAGTGPANPARNRLMSLALRPAPVTDQWLVEGRRLTDLEEATRDVTLIEVDSPRTEANAIALALREAVETGQSAALITPDRTLTRQVTAALDRWRITPDDSAGRPLPLSAPGRLLRHVADLFGRTLTVEALLTLLKHPLTGGTGSARGQHLLHTRDLELHLRRYGSPFPTRQELVGWAGESDPDRLFWVEWLGDLLTGLDTVGTRALTAHVDHHVALTQALCAGPGQDGSGGLWDRAAGDEALRRMSELRTEAPHGGTLGPADYAALLTSVLQRGEVREATLSHPGVMIWGTLEARVQGADLVILGGLNEGVWPEAPKPDPWLNRRLRDRAGLLLPERRIGLSAHDFQQAVAARRVILTRSIRDAEAQTVPSRWINRLCNLLNGLPEGGRAALEGMRERGARWTALATRLDAPEAPVDPEPRPSPQPLPEKRPNKISITEVERLIRDPYAIYARRVLGLSPLDPLRREPDALLRGTLMHTVLERFIRDGWQGDPVAEKARLIALADAVMEEQAPWPAARRLWRAKLLGIADWFIATEAERQARATPLALECKAVLPFPDLDLELGGKVDRVDRTDAGTLHIYDYKTGRVPTEPEQEHFQKQLYLSAMLAERDGLPGIPPLPVTEVAFIGLGSGGSFKPVALEPGQTASVHAEFVRLMAAWRDPQKGYTARRAVDRTGFAGDYDHLSRFGEWDESSPPSPQRVGKWP